MTVRRWFSWAGRRIRRDDGAILIIAIVIVTTVALVVGAVLTRGSGSLRAGVALRDVSGTAYAADSAANVAINNLRKGQGFTSSDKFDNTLASAGGSTAGKGCFGGTIADNGTDYLSLDGFYPATGTVKQSSAYIECTGEKGTGAQGSPVPISSSNKPGQAILTLANSGASLDFGQSSETNTVHGSVTSNGGLQVKNNSTFNVTGTGVSVNAVGGCNHAVQVNGTNTPCGSTGIQDPGLSSPKYDPPATLPAWPATPTCPTSANGPQTFYPGYYPMTPATAGVGSRTITVTVSSGSSGTFLPTLTAPTGYPPATAQAWNVAPAALQTSLRASWSIPVTVTGTQTTATVAGSYAITFPGILGTSPTMTVQGTGLGAGKSVSQSPTTLGQASCSLSVGWYYFAPQNVSTTGVYYFNWSGFWSLPGTAVGGTLATNNLGTGKGGTSIAPAGGAPRPTQPGACVNPIKDPDAVGVQLVFGGSAQLNPVGSPLKEFCATYSSTSIPTVIYGLKSSAGAAPGPVVPAQTACVANSSCAMVRITTGNQSVIYFQGFVYAPRAHIDVDVNNASQPFFNFGLITNTLHIGQTGNGCGTCAYINLPDNSLGYGTKSTIVVMKVHVCQGSAIVTAACKAKTPALIARVQMWDIDGDRSKRQVAILSWSHSR